MSHLIWARRAGGPRAFILCLAVGLGLLAGGWGLAPGHEAQAASPPARAAHAAPSVIHDYLVRIGGHEAQVFLRFAVSPQLVPQVYHLVDQNGDNRISPAEHQAWIDRYVASMRFTIDDQPVPFRLVGASTFDEHDLVISMHQPVTVTLQLTYTVAPDPPGQPPSDHHFVLADNANYVGYDEYYSSFEDDPGAVTLSHDLTQPANPALFEAVFNLDPATAAATPTALAAPPVANGPPQEPAGSLFLTQLDSFLQNPRGNTQFGLLLFVFAVLLGGLHALTPGHGKAVVAAYLVGSRGRVRDAVALGWIVTLTHTLSVVALGLVLLLISNFVLPRWLQPALELGSGLLIVLLGLYLLASRLYQLRTGRGLRGRRPDAAPALAHDHDHDHAQTQGAAHEHNHEDDGHAHSHESGQVHDHGAGAHSHVPPAGTSARDLIALGISGGLVPCPDALAILLLTLPVGQIGLGLALVSSFSLGLAAVLIIIGVLMVRARALLERLLPGRGDASPGWVRALPVASAVVVVVLGVVLMVGAVTGQKWV